MRKSLLTFAMALTIIAAAVLGSNAHAGAIAWMTSVDINDSGSFLNTTGTLVAALNADTAGDNATIGGITFAGTDLAAWNAGVTGVGGVTIASNAPNGGFGTTFVQNSGPPSNITDADVNNLVGSGIWGTQPVTGTQTVTLGGLTVGDTYIIQILGNDSRNGRSDGFVTVLSDGVNTIAGSLAAGTAGLNQLSGTPFGGGGPDNQAGDAIVGTFVAMTATQSFDISGSTNGGTSANSADRAQINGFQLRTVPAAIPEPSSAVVGLFGLACLVMKRRRS